MIKAQEMQSQLHHLRFLPLLVLAMLVNILAQATHETGHHMAYQIMGHEPIWAFTKLVQMWETTPANPDEWVAKTNSDGSTSWLKLNSLPSGKTENAVVSAAGPLAGLFGAVLGLVMTRRSVKVTWKQVWLAFALTASLVAVLYYLRSPMRTGGDQYDIALQMGVAKSVIEIPFAVAFIACLFLALRELPSWRVRASWLGTILLGSIATGLPMTMLDPIIIAQIDAGNPWFRSVMGYSLPVFLTILITFLGVWIWARRQNGVLE